MTIEEFIIMELDAKANESIYIGLAPKSKYNPDGSSSLHNTLEFYQWLTHKSTFIINELRLNNNCNEVTVYIINVRQLLNLDDKVSKKFIKSMNFIKAIQGGERYHFYNSETDYSETTYKCFVYTNLTDIYKNLEKKKEIHQAIVKNIETMKADLWKATHP